MGRETTAMTIEELAKVRKKESISQQQIADYMQVSKAYVSKLESGKSNANKDILEKYMNAIHELTNQPEVSIENRVYQLIIDCHETTSQNWEEKLKEGTFLSEKVRGKDQLEAEVNVCLSIIYRCVAIRKYDLAIEFVQKAIDFYRSKQPMFQVDYAEALFELAQLYMRTDKQLLAEEMHTMVTTILEASDPYHRYRYISLGNLAMFASNFGREAEALRYVETCEQLAPLVTWGGRKWNEKTANMYKFQMRCLFLYVKANIAENKKDYLGAIAYYQECLRVSREAYGLYDGLKIRDFRTIDYIASLYIKIGDYKMAETYLVESITEREKDLHDHTSYYLDSLNYLTTCYLETQRYDEAIQQAQKIIDFDTTGTVSKAIAYRHMGQAYQRRDNNHSLYREYVNRAIDVISHHEAYHKLDLYQELLSELMNLN